jgi:DnaJ-class molecular chaperone
MVEFKCHACKGKGIKKIIYKGCDYKAICVICNGTGKLDWVENILYKKQQYTWELKKV